MYLTKVFFMKIANSSWVCKFLLVSNTKTKSVSADFGFLTISLLQKNQFFRIYTFFTNHVKTTRLKSGGHLGQLIERTILSLCILLLLPCSDYCEPHRDKTNKMACAPSKDSDQPGHPPSLIRVFAVCLKKTRILSYPLSAQQRHWSDGADAQADLSLQWVHMPFCWFCHDAAHCEKVKFCYIWAMLFLL